MKLLALIVIAALLAWLLRRGLPHDGFDEPRLPNVDWAGW